MQKKYTILTATGGVSGTFVASVNTRTAIKLPFSVELRREQRLSGPDLAFAIPGGLNVNQQNVGNALTIPSTAPAAFPPRSPSMTAGGLSQAAGETATGSQQTTFNAMNQFMGVMTDPFMRARRCGNAGGNATGYADEEALAYAAKAQSERCAGRDLSPRRRRARRSSSAGACGRPATAARRPPTAIRRSAPTTATIAGSMAPRSAPTTGSRRSPRRLLAGWRRHQFQRRQQRHRAIRPVPGRCVHPAHIGAAYLSGALAYGWQDITTDRTVTIAGIDQLRAQFNANAWSGRVEGGYRFVDAVDRRDRLHALRGRPVHDVRTAGLCGRRRLGRQHVCTGLWRKERDRYPQRTRPPHRQVLCDAERDPDVARPRRLGA